MFQFHPVKESIKGSAGNSMLDPWPKTIWLRLNQYQACEYKVHLFVCIIYHWFRIIPTIFHIYRILIQCCNAVLTLSIISLLSHSYPQPLLYLPPCLITASSNHLILILHQPLKCRLPWYFTVHSESSFLCVIIQWSSQTPLCPQYLVLQWSEENSKSSRQAWCDLVPSILRTNHMEKLRVLLLHLHLSRNLEKKKTKVLHKLKK